MKRVIRLTESDLVRLVKRVITESESYDDMTIPEIADTQIGVPYRSGGTRPKDSSNPGFDCSGFAKWILKAAGYFNDENGNLDKTKYNSFPGWVQGQYDSSLIEKIDEPNIQIGDFVYFTHKGDKVKGHVGVITQVYDTDFSMVHASSKRGITQDDDVMKKGWWGKITGYGRFIGERNFPPSAIANKD